METILAIETSVPEASIALWSDGVWLFDQGFTSDRNHNSVIFDCLGEALESLQGRALTAVVVGTGPGSYSGTRIGIAAAQGVAIARGCPAVGIGSLAATPVARSHGAVGAVGESMAVGDARRGMYFISRIAATGEAMEAGLMDAGEFAARLREAPGTALFTFDDPARLGLDEELASRVLRTRPEARLLIDVWLGLDESRRRELSHRPLSPSYLRAPFTSKAKSGHPLLRQD
ncbi:MAG: tRNA (adenosine(37)-N6)-threonylcarbamoyltransferase complex dimerization subunit type 1 TsaB [Akkermansiaceae bacterium]|nr:tRNA (adenosine(37)-N6)-threonylcarbamoyltransferase complex dimerization subunit type 1 TsaB [Akkermansiaceae bacterium]